MRLFTFGCSNTKYHYPTWADIMGREYDFFENWGRPGAGNNYILNALTQCHMLRNLTTDDHVIILWTGLARIDYYQLNDWCHKINNYYDSKKDSTYSCPNGYQWLSFAWITAAQHMLDNLGVNYTMLHWQEFDQDTAPYMTYSQPLSKLIYAPLIKNPKPYYFHPQSKPNVKLLYNRLKGQDWPNLDSILNGSFHNLKLPAVIVKELEHFLDLVEQTCRLDSKFILDVDTHPSPLQHLKWIEKFFPKVSISQNTRLWASQIDTLVFTGQPYSF